MARHILRNLALTGATLLVGCGPLVVEEGVAPRVPTGDPNPVELDEGGSIDDLESDQSGEIVLPTQTSSVSGDLLPTAETTTAAEVQSQSDYLSGIENLQMIPPEYIGDAGLDKIGSPGSDDRLYVEYVLNEINTNYPGYDFKIIVIPGSNGWVPVSLIGGSLFVPAVFENGVRQLDTDLSPLAAYLSDSGQLPGRVVTFDGDFRQYSPSNGLTPGFGHANGRIYFAGFDNNGTPAEVLNASWVDPSGALGRWEPLNNQPAALNTETPDVTATALSTETPVPTSTVVPTPTFEAPTPAPTPALVEGMSNFTFEVSDDESITVPVRSEYLVVIEGENAAKSFNVVGDAGSRVLYIGSDTALAYETAAGWLVDDTLHLEPDYIGLGPALTKHMLSVSNNDLTALASQPGHVDIGAHGGFNIVAAYPAKLTSLDVESVVFRDAEGNLTQTYRGNLGFAFRNPNSLDPTSIISATTTIYDTLYVNNNPVSLPNLASTVQGSRFWSLGFMTDYTEPVKKDLPIRNIQDAVTSTANAVREDILNGGTVEAAWLGAIN